MAKTNIQEELRLLHTIPPVFNRNSKILILGSFPSVKSRENDIEPILQTANISQIFTNGSTADKLYKKHIYPFTQIEAIKLPSTSPANAAFTLDKLLREWNVILKYL